MKAGFEAIDSGPGPSLVIEDAMLRGRRRPDRPRPYLRA
jgi:hypothetical protein